MTDRPIIFSAAMIQALLAGRKTQRRRILKDQSVWERAGEKILARFPNQHGTGYEAEDRLWVRENWQGLSFGDYLPTKSRTCDLRYAADDTLGSASKDVRGYPWRPSIHMPRWASRLTLLVTEVRVQRLQDISEEDALAEGIHWSERFEGYCSDDEGRHYHGGYPFRAFESLWDGIHGEGAWEANPWIVAVSFSVQRGNIDALPVTERAIGEARKAGE